MKLVLYLSAITFVAVCATWAYRVNYSTREAMGRVVELRREIAREHEALNALRGEWAYLNRPERLRALVAQNRDALGLVPLNPEHFGTVAIVAYPPEPDNLQETAVEAEK
ncbi:cell division protein FtsL [Amaricoccus macauensis]|uniref:cell division protein FtsL n=1 Tax=Amaricoccus macauensis TaxID=57001 RepID=UPI003C7A7AAB